MTFFTITITLLLVLDPFGNIPLFLSVLSHTDKNKHKLIIIRELIIAFAILSIFLFFGQYILSAMNISEPALSISGGIILFMIALRMIFPARLIISEEEEYTPNPLIVPLAIPLVAGPSSMTMVILLSRQFPEKLITLFYSLILACSISLLILLAGAFLFKLLGTRVIKAIERLMGMILTTMAIQMLLSGIHNFMAN